MTYDRRFYSTVSAIALLSFSCLLGSAQQVGSPVPDSIAYTALYHVVHDAPPPHWDRETCQSWLAERGLTGFHAQAVMFAANRYMQKHAEIESELRTLNSQTRNSLASEAQARRSEIETRRSAELLANVKELKQSLGSDGAAKLDNLIQDVKSGINMKRSAIK